MLENCTKIIPEQKLGFKNVLIKPCLSSIVSRKDVCVDVEYNFKWSNKSWKGVPIIAANMDTTGTIEMAKVLNHNNILTCLHKFYSYDDWHNIKDDINDYYSITIGSDNFEHLSIVLSSLPHINIITIDVANGYRLCFLDFIKKVRQQFTDKIIIAGNVTTPEMAVEIINAGADIVKVGIGGGSACSTTNITGIGYPQLAAILECAPAVHAIGGKIISDGGCKEVGDIAKAFCAGADFVMLGGMLAGHDESGGKLVEKNDKIYKEFYGMSSTQAQEKYYQGMKNYRASEGKSSLVEYRGPVQDTINTILGGLRSTCTYTNSSNLTELVENGKFIRV